MAEENTTNSVATEPELTSADYQNVDKLMKAVQFGDFKFVETAVDKYHVSVDTQDKDGCSLLHWAAINNRVNIIEFLLQRRAQVNATGGDNGEIPLQWAVRHAHCTATVHLLIQEGSNLSHRSVYGYDSLFLAVQAGHLHIVYLLLHAGANINTIDLQNDTPLYWLLRHEVSKNTLDMQRLLLRFHASVSQRGCDGRVALHYVTESGTNFDMHSAFLIYMANYSEMVLDAKSNSGRTPYESAWKMRNAAVLRFLFDARMYTTLPKWFPIATRALTIFSFFLLLKNFGWVYGGLLAILVHFSADLLSQKYILRGSSRDSCGFAWGVTATATWAYYTYVSPLLNNAFWDWMIAIFAFLIGYTLLKSMNTPAQYLYCETDDASAETIISKILESTPILDLSGRAIGINYRICPTCLVDKSLVSTHCSQCDRCAVSLDHHCPFVNNCVGKGNRRVFVLFTLFAGLGCELMALLSLYVQNYSICSDATGMLGGIFAVQTCTFAREPTLFCATWLAMLTGIWILFIMGGQLGLVASETTTFEVLKRGNYGLPAFSWRGLHNLGKFFLTGQYYVIEPSAVPVRACCSSGHDHGSHRHDLEAQSSSVPQSDSVGSLVGAGDRQLQRLRHGVAELAVKAQLVNTEDDE